MSQFLNILSGVYMLLLYDYMLVFCLSAVLQFVPSHVDVRMCTFSEQAEKGLITALSEVRRRSQESTNFTVNVRWLLYPVYGIKSSAECQTPITRCWTPLNPRNYFLFNLVYLKHTQLLHNLIYPNENYIVFNLEQASFRL